METPGLMLKREREARGLTLAELSKVTRIPEPSLENIENNAFDAFPAEVFTRGFLRNYARQLSISSSEIMQAYEAYTHQDRPVVAIEDGSEPEAPAYTYSPETHETAENDDQPRHSFRFAYVAIILIALASLGLSVMFVGTGEAEESDGDYLIESGDTAESPFLISNTADRWIGE